MKLITHCAFFLLLAWTAGCTSIGNQDDTEILLGTRKQKSLLAKARPMQEFGFSVSFPFSNGMPYFGATLLEPNQYAEKRFEAADMPIIRMHGESSRKTLTILLDTASNASWMQYACAAQNDLVFLAYNGQAIPYSGAAGTKGANAFAGVVPLLHIGQLTLNNTPFYIRMAGGTMVPVVYSTAPPRVNAVLGYDNLRQFQYIQFDLRTGTVRFSTSTPYIPDEDRLMDKVAISAICRDRLAVEGSVFGEEIPIVLDFAGDFAFARGDVRDPVTKQVELGNVVFLDVPNEVLATQDPYPRAGRRMLEQYVVTVSPRTGFVYFERPL